MSDRVAFFRGPAGTCAVALPFDLETRLAEWQTIRRALVATVPEPFSRDEWAYVVSSVDRDQLLSWFTTTFGERSDPSAETASRLHRPRGAVAVWLPNNVSLLGPILLIALSLLGQPVRLKLGSSADDLVQPFIRHVLGLLPDSTLRTWLAEDVETVRLERDDPGHARLTAESQVRVVFGSDEAARAVDALPHPLSSVGFPFVDRQSEAWIEPDAITDGLLITLARVFAIYGQAGCTSPRRVLLLGGTDLEAREFRDQLLVNWSRAVRVRVPAHTASENIMATQWATALGWDAVAAPEHAAVLAAGALDLPGFDAPFALRISPATIDEAVGRLPDNIQTIGHALTGKPDEPWLSRIAGTRIARFVPIGRMHHFSSTWDGYEFWRQCFEVVEIGHG